MAKMDPIEAPNRTFQLPDGSTLGYAEYGCEAGKPVFYFHGYPGGRVEAALLAKAAAQANTRLIGVDRPGMGLSSFQTNRRLLDWPDDIAALAQHLQIARFAIVGFSGGGPYALACAYKIPELLTACGVVAGMGPPEYDRTGMMVSNRLLFLLAHRLPWLVTPVIWAIGRSCQRQEQAVQSQVHSAPHLVEPDRACVLDPETGAILAASSVEAFRQGARGPAYEGLLYARPWGFNVEDIAFPAIFLWHGGRDKNVPATIGRSVASRLAHCQMAYTAEDGHLSLVVNHATEIIAALGSWDA